MKRDWSLRGLILKLNAVSIRVKIVVLVAVCIGVSSGTVVWVTDQDARRSAQEESQNYGIALADVIVGHSKSMIENGELSVLAIMADDSLAVNTDLIYIRIMDAVGDVVVESTRLDLAGLMLNDGPLTSTSPYIQKIHHQGQQVTDIAVPVPDYGRGAVHVGLTDANISRMVAVHIQSILRWLILVIVFVLVVAYILSYILTYPISVLAAQARELGRGAYTESYRHWGNDEIGHLGLAFDEMNREISQKDQMRSQLLAQILGAQEDERKRIARELHDDTSQSLTSLMVELKAAENATSLTEIKPILAELRSLAHQTLEVVHSMAMDLRPNALDDLGFVAALRKYVTDFSTKNGIAVDLQVNPLARRRFPPEVETAAYRIVQEALINTIRHAQASDVSVVVNYQDGVLTVIVEDDGIGFDPEEVSRLSPEHRLGLFGMYERASLIGGKLVIESRPGTGTSIFLEVPIQFPHGGEDGEN